MCGRKGSRGGYERSSTPLAAHWDGRELQVMNPFTHPSPHGELSAVVAVARDDVWAVGIDDWGARPPCRGALEPAQLEGRLDPRLGWEGELSDIAALSADDVRAIGELNAQPERPLLVRWNGERWRVVDMRNVVPKASGVLAMGGTSSSDVRAVGERRAHAETGRSVAAHSALRRSAWKDVALPWYDGEAIRGHCSRRPITARRVDCVRQRG